MRRTSGAGVVLVLALAACGGTTTEPVASPAAGTTSPAATDPPTTGPAPDAVVQDPGCDLSGLPPRTAALTTLTADGTLGTRVDLQPDDGPPDPLLDATSYYAEADGAVRAYDAATGEQRWAVPTAEVDALWLDGGTLIASVDRFGPAPHLLALDAATGEQRWRYELAKPLLGTQSLTGDGGLAWVRLDGPTQVLDLRTSTVRWSAAGPVRGYSFSVAQGVVVRGLRGAMTAYDSRTGEVRWTAPPGGAPKGWGDVVLQEGAPNDAPLYDGWVAAYDAASGTRLWRFDTGPNRVAARGPAGVLLAQKSGYRLVARDGTVRFAAKKYVSISGRASVGVDDVLMTEGGVGGSEVGAVVSRAPDGTERWRVPVRIGDPLLRLGTTVVALRTEIGGTTARGYDGDTGAARWTRTVPTSLAGTAVLGERAVLALNAPPYGCPL